MILCCGDSKVDMLPCQTSSGLPAYMPHPGGTGFLTALALGRLGVPTELLTGMSRDLFGNLLEQNLNDTNVGHRYAIRSDRQTALAFGDLTDHAAYNMFYADNAADRMVNPDSLPDIGDEILALHFGGISLSREPCGSAFEKLLQREHGNKLVFVDAATGPDLVNGEQAYRERMERMIARSDIIHVSSEYFAWLHPDEDLALVAGSWLASGTRIVIVSDRVHGAFAHHLQGKTFINAPNADNAAIASARDVFNAGCLASLWRNGFLSKSRVAEASKKDLESALILGAKAASATLSKNGTTPPWGHEIEF